VDLRSGREHDTSSGWNIVVTSVAEPQTSGAARQETEITLAVLDAVQHNSGVTQRSMARELGIALGLANAYLRRCMRKGWVKVKQIPPNRYLYYLTPKGFAEKSRLTGEYLTSSFTFFRRARAQYDEALTSCCSAGWRRVALVGRSEMAEIAALCNAEHRLDLVVIGDEAGGRAHHAGLPAVATLAEAGEIDAAIVTDLMAPQRCYEALLADLPPEKVLTPALLRVARTRRH
jgi:DNA-binding MarR family transcriptional regulator